MNIGGVTGLKIFIYCQHVWGLGHFFRILEIARALERHDVVLVTGGPEVAMPLPAHVRRYQLPILRMREDKKLVAHDGGSSEDVWPERIARLHDLFRAETPDVFLVELYPLGRKKFRRELDSLLAGIRCGRLPPCRVYCSVRDILVEKPDPRAYETRVCRDLNRWFDALLVHADPSLVTLDTTFGATAEIKIPVVYTGYVAAAPAEGFGPDAFRRQKGIAADEKLVVVSAGGGQSGYPLLTAALAAERRLRRSARVRMALFTGPYLCDTQWAELHTAAGPAATVRRFATDFAAWLAAADLSISMAGYNTCMNLLTAGVPALVWPFTGDREQPLRAAQLEAGGWLSVLSTEDLAPDRFAARIEKALSPDARPAASIDLEGAVNTARYIEAPRRSRKRRPPKSGMKVLVYCQHVLGLGHFFRTLEICRALADHDVILVAGGPDPPVDLPANVRLRRLPELVMDANFGNLHSPEGMSLEAIRDERRRRLRAALREEMPELFLIELYPIGRKAFRFELDPLLAEIGAGQLPACKVICSVRDILVEKEDTRRHETRAMTLLNRWFDALLVHADPDLVRLEETFGQMAALEIPVVYTGYVAAPAAEIPDRDAWRRLRGIDPECRLVLASAGGGAVGFDLLQAVARAVARLQSRYPIILQAFTGPFMPPQQSTALASLAGPVLRIERFSEDFSAWLQAADVSVSMAGYNTCMNILATRANALVYPFPQNREQGMRARRLAARGAVDILSPTDLRPERMAERLLEKFDRVPSPATIRLDGATQTAAWMESVVTGGGQA